MKDRFPRWKIAGQQTLGAATPHEAEDSVEDATERMTAGTPAPRRGGWGHERLQELPLRIRHMTEI